MKKLAMAVMALTVSASTVFAGNPEGEKTYTINTAESKIVWVGKKVTGEHTGNVTFKGGEFTEAKGNLISGNAAVDMNTITTTDLDGEWAEKLVGHLKSDDFFSVASHPESTFEMSDFLKANKKGLYTIKGSLIIKGISHPISFPVEVKMNDEKLVMKGSVTFDRTNYDIKYGSGKFFEGLGDKMIDDEVKFDFAIVAEAK